MALTDQERKVLTLMQDINVQDFVHFARRYVDMEIDQIREIAAKLRKEGYVDVLEGADKTDLIFEHTNKVSQDMIDQKLKNLVAFGEEDPQPVYRK